MAVGVNFRCSATAVGSMPHVDAGAACRDVLRYLPDFPAWPQLPSRSLKEGQYAQFSEGFPGLNPGENKFFVDRSGNLDEQIEKLYRAYLDRDFDSFPTTRQHAEGLHTFLSLPEITPLALKGQITGPITFGLGISDNEQRPILYDDTLSDVLAKFLHLKAAWQERRLKTVSRQTIIFVDEPSLSYFGSAFVSMSGEKVITLINEVLGGISGLKGIHCCSNTDWPTVLSTNIDIVNFDAYGFAREFSLYPAEVSRFIARGGCVAWGIVPNTEKDLKKESVVSFRDCLDEA